jgi:Protein of unknown function (DUF2797)
MQADASAQLLGSGVLRAMRAQPADPVRFELQLDEHSIALNDLLGEALKIEFDGRITCRNCGAATRKSYADGHCYRCFKTLASCDLCVMAPVRCHYAAGTCREPAWGEAFCMQPHLVYLANSAGLKVGVTKPQHVPGRWLDQGATEALPIFSTATRHQAGCIEAALARYVSDRTDWRKLVRSDADALDLLLCAQQLMARAAEPLRELDARFAGDLQRVDGAVQRFAYPVLRYAAPARLLALEAGRAIGGELLGIKGQYLLFDSGVFNVRRHCAYHLTVSRAAGGEPVGSDQLELFK